MKPGRRMTSAPTKPTAVSAHRRGPIFSPRNSPAYNTTHSGIVAFSAVASATPISAYA